ncbi:MAG: BamA/TamA family outer membrane protein [Steroidobacteraceae bacterium]
MLLGPGLALQACSTMGSRDEGRQEDPAEAGAAPLSFEVKIESSDRRIASHLRQYLDIQRFRSFPDLQAGELRRLMAEAESNARDLLAALGYFRPQLELSLEQPEKADAPRRIVIKAEPGEQARVASYDVRFAEPMDSDPRAAAQRDAIRGGWMLREDRPFTQEDWDAAKTGGLRALQRERYPAARIAESQARVNADTLRADLHITYDPGAPYRFGALELRGVERYDADGIRNIARIPTGSDYSETALLDAQQRLVNSGYFDAAFLMLNPDEAEPDHATVIAQLREAQYQKVVFGLGFSTDTGPRVSVDHTHNEMWPLGWRAINQFALGTSTQLLATRWTAMPVSSGWAWYTGAAVERSDYGDFTARSVSLTGGRMKSGERIDRRYYVQYDLGTTEGNGAPGGSSSILANYAWTGRYFDDRTNPNAGHGLGAEAGLGFTLSPHQDPFLRFSARALQFWPFGERNEAGKRSRLALRADLGAIYAAAGVNIPVRLLFLTGGDTTVRGYGYQAIGTRLDDGSVYGARYMASGSVEWQRPIKLFGDAASFEHATFVDVGTATDTLSQYTLYTGVGTGLRWSSPVGPLQVDMAYGIHDRQWRLHLRMGFQF